MNIFFLHRNPKIAARMQCDKHVVKMVLETAQMLSTAARAQGHDVQSYRYYYYNEKSSFAKYTYRIAPRFMQGGEYLEEAS